ncbi:hypothetical protein AC249_AIPGENE23147, partial [Exaiptasia diaphana]
MLAQVVLGKIPSAAADRTDHGRFARTDFDQGPHRISIQTLALQVNLQPMARVFSFVAKHLGSAVEIADDHIEPAVVVEISDRGASAHGLLAHWILWAADDFVKGPVTTIVEQHPSLTIRGRCLELDLIDLGVDMTVDQEEIQPAVVVHVEERGAPAHISNAHRRGLGAEGGVAEVAPFVIVVERVVFLGKVGDEEAQPTLVAVITHGNAHGALLLAVFAHRDTQQIGHLLEGAVFLVQIEKIRRRVIRHIEVLPAVPVGVEPGDSQTEHSLLIA